MKTVNKNEMSITYEDERLSCKKVVYGVYQKSIDITVIFEDIINKQTDNVISTEIKGFYFGLPEIKFIQEYYGELKAEFQL